LPSAVAALVAVATAPLLYDAAAVTVAAAAAAVAIASGIVVFGGVGVWRSFANVAPATVAVVVVKSVGASVAAATARPSSS